jgi:phosphopantetheinyl transferase (holo-ACP synthase)
VKDRGCHLPMESPNQDEQGSAGTADSVEEFRPGRQEVIRDLTVESVPVGDHPVLYARATLSGSERRDPLLRRALQEKLAKLLWNRSLFPSDKIPHPDGEFGEPPRCPARRGGRSTQLPYRLPPLHPGAGPFPFPLPLGEGWGEGAGIPLLKAQSIDKSTGSHGVTHDVRIARTILGRPNLCISGQRCGSISFSWTTGVLWAALAEEGLGLGIDAATAAEFDGPYPYERVFDEPERGAWFAGGRETYPETAALVWSGKEAVVKAIGSGFHLIAPLEVAILPCEKHGERFMCGARFSDRTLQRFPELRSAKACIVSFKESQAWVSIALIEGTSKG